MACPGGCIAGAGQPVSGDVDFKQLRAEALYATDKKLQLHNADENPYLHKCYQQNLGDIGGHKAHELLHTKYNSRKRFDDDGFIISAESSAERLRVDVCVGTSCYLRGSQKMLEDVMNVIRDRRLEDQVEVRATFCFEKCQDGPTVRVGQTVLNQCTVEMVSDELMKQIKQIPVASSQKL